MEQKKHVDIIPLQYEGKELQNEAAIEFQHETDAKSFYLAAREKLLEVNEWHNIAGLISARFQVTDQYGNEVNRKVRQGDYLKIDIPGPGSKEGDGFDWVHVEELKEVGNGAIESVGFRVRPSENPRNHSDGIAHFYDDSATSNFIVTREERTVKAIVIDKNLKPNNESSSVIDKLRNTAVGASALSAFSNIQWKNLVNGIMDPKT